MASKKKPKPAPVSDSQPARLQLHLELVLQEVLAKAGTATFLTGLLWPTDLDLAREHDDRVKLRQTNKPSLVRRLAIMGYMELLPVPGSQHWGYKVTEKGINYAREHGLLPKVMQ